jgi:retron-type reverse transcriptase
LTNYLGILNGLEYNYDVDKKRFMEKINDQKILDVVDDIKKCFRISGNKYTEFNKEDGYEKGYTR